MSSDYNKHRCLDAIPTAAGGEDRFSELPDAIIHNILDLLNSPKEAAKTSVLSPRWFKLWRSYPILEFYDTQFGSEQSAKRFVAAAARKFSRHSDGTLTDMKAVRIFFEHREDWDPQFCSALLGEILELAVERSPPPQHIHIVAEFDDNIDRLLRFDGSGTYTIPRGLLLPKSNSNSGLQFRLKFLKLADCNFDQYKDMNLNFGSYLRVLDLFCVSFPAGEGGDGILNSLIAGASCLQNLTLLSVVGIRRFQVRNLPNLKLLYFHQCPLEDIEITGVHSLEYLIISYAPLGGDFVVSSMPNLKVLEIHDACKLTKQKIDELISKSPSLESLSLRGLAKVHELKIVNAKKLQKVQLRYWNELQVLQMDAPNLHHFYYSGRIDFLLTLLGQIGGNYKEVGQSLNVLYSSSKVDGNRLYTLRNSLVQLTRFWFRLILEFNYLPSYMYRENPWKEVQEEFLVPGIEHVIISWSFARSFDIDVFFYGLFQNFHPNSLSFTQELCSSSMPTKYLLISEYICKEFMKRDSHNFCETECKCWRHQFKNMKIIKRARAGQIQAEDGDQVMDISTDVCSSLGEVKQIMLLLTWD